MIEEQPSRCRLHDDPRRRAAEYIPLTRKRITGIVSRAERSSGSGWRPTRNRISYTIASPTSARFRKHDVSFSLGDGLRPGCLADASDAAQFAELKTLGELTKIAWEHDVQVMIEGPGHIPMDQIKMQVEKEMEMCHEAPFYTLGPLVTDIAPGYDHITSAIGAAMIGWHGAAMLCYVTPRNTWACQTRKTSGLASSPTRSRHTRRTWPSSSGARDRDDALSHARFLFDWNKQFELSLDPDTARRMHDETLPDDYYKDAKFCAMCGPKFCSMNTTQIMDRHFGLTQDDRQQKFAELLVKVQGN